MLHFVENTRKIRRNVPTHIRTVVRLERQQNGVEIDDDIKYKKVYNGQSYHKPILQIFHFRMAGPAYFLFRNLPLCDILRG